MKPNIVNFSDFHAHIFQDFSKPDAKFTTDRFKEQMLVLQSVFDYAKDHDADVLFNGDLFHKRGVIDIRVFNWVYSIFTDYPDITMYLVRGNHDSLTNSINSPSCLELFETIPNVHVVDTMQKIETPYYDLYCVAYGEEVELMKQWIKDASTLLNPDKVNILCAHIGVDGSSTGKYSHTLSGAFKVSDLYPDKFDIVTLGHYHKRQNLGGMDNVFYVGNTLQTSFSDEGQDKGFYFISIDRKKWIKEFIKTDYRPFITINAENAPDDLSKAFYQFVGDPAEAKVVSDLKEKEDLSNLRISVQRDYDTKPRINIQAGSTPQDVVKAYTEKNNPKLEEKALEIIREAEVSK